MGAKKAARKAAKAAIRGQNRGMVVHGGGGLELAGGAAGSPQLKEESSAFLWECGAVAAGRKWVNGELADIDTKYKNEGQRAEAKRKLAFKLIGGGYIGVRSFAKGEALALGARAAAINGAVLLADLI